MDQDYTNIDYCLDINDVLSQAIDYSITDALYADSRGIFKFHLCWNKRGVKREAVYMPFYQYVNECKRHISFICQKE